MENIENVKNNARCVNCGTDFYASANEKTVKCPSCGEELSATMATKYYESLNEIPEKTKEAHGEDLQRLNAVLDELYGLVAMGEFKKAEEKFYEALSLSDTDYRVYMAMVAIKTKNYTDLKDQEHKQYINKAISFADADEKKEIVKTYRAYYYKCGLTEEELDAFSVEENKMKKEKLEKGLKSMIPEYMAKEKRNVLLLVLFPILLVLGVTLVILAIFYEDIAWIAIIGAVATITGYILFRNWFVNKDRIKTFNSLLDFYDFVEASNYEERVLSTLYRHMQNLCDKFLDNIPVVSMSDDTIKLIDYLVDFNDKKMNEFLLKDKYFSQFVTEE
ncbi:MAG: hypothetical protein IJC87_04155 [Clostridia bacterium]|nr:hypothetical protein [Clostridia bacterium]